MYRRNLPLYLFLRIRWWHANLDRVAEFVPKRGRILDLGCGYGLFANYIALESTDREVVGVELSKRKLRHAGKGLPNTRFIAGNITSLGLSSVDTVLLLHVLHHLESREEQVALLQACAKELAHQGQIIIEEIDRRPWYKYLATICVDHVLYGRGPFHFRPATEWAAVLERLGLEVQVVPVHRGKPLSHVVIVARRRQGQ